MNKSASKLLNSHFQINTFYRHNSNLLLQYLTAHESGGGPHALSVLFPVPPCLSSPVPAGFNRVALAMDQNPRRSLWERRPSRHTVVGEA
jgi:hypothetical protein